MANVVHEIIVNVLRGFEQKDTRWAQISRNNFQTSVEPFGFWETTTTIQPTRNDLRLLQKERTQGVQSGERPGQLPSPEFAPFTTVDPEQCDSHVFPEDRVSTLKIAKSKSRKITKTLEGFRVVGQERDQFNQVVQITEPVIDIEGIEVLLETNSFLLQNIREGFQEKYQISETFGEPILFLFDERQKIFQFSGLLFDSSNWNWKEKFIENYNRELRGSRAVENGAQAILTTNTAIIRGQILSCSIAQDQTYGVVAFDFTMFVQDRFPLEQIARSPQDTQEAQEDDPQSVFIRINNQTFKPGDVLKELSKGAANVTLASTHTFLNVPGTPVDTMRLIGPLVVNGKNLPFELAFNEIGPGLIDPPDLEFVEDLPAGFLGQLVLANLGRLEDERLKVMEVAQDGTFPGNIVTRPDASTFTVTDTIPRQSMGIARDQSNTRVVFHRGGGGFVNYPLHSLNQIQLMKSASALKAIIFGPSGLKGVERTVSAVRSFNDSPTAFASKREGTGLGPVRPAGGSSVLENNNQLAFEIEFDTAFTPGDIGLPGSQFGADDVVRVLLFDPDRFQPNTGVPALIYHMHEIRKARRVGNQSFEIHPNANQKHVLFDTGSQFMATDALHLNLAAGDKIFVTLPYEVIDRDAETLTPTTKVEVRKILSDTQLELGRLAKNPGNASGLSRGYSLAPIALTSYKIIVERASQFDLIESAIRESIKNPPNGAFSNPNIEIAELKQPRGVLPLVKGTHFEA